MDAHAQKKALYRTKLREAAQKQEKRIDSPLVRYNEYDQPVCRVCDVTLKSESLWAAHQVSRKHHEAIKNVKAAASGGTLANVAKSEPQTSLIHKPHTSSSLPADFFDKRESKKRKSFESQTGSSMQPTTVKSVDLGSSLLVQEAGTNAVRHSSELADSKSSLSRSDASVHMVESKVKSDNQFSSQFTQSAVKDISEAKQVKGVLPVGFFDNKDSDLRARGIEPVKVDIKDEYKEFEKAIQEDLQEVDERQEEEEVDAAEMLMEAELLEQKAYRERVEMLKKMQADMKAAKLARAEKRTLTFKGEESSGDSSGGEGEDADDDEEDFTVDWRAQHL